MLERLNIGRRKCITDAPDVRKLIRATNDSNRSPPIARIVFLGPFELEDRYRQKRVGLGLRLFDEFGRSTVAKLLFGNLVRYEKFRSGKNPSCKAFARAIEDFSLRRVSNETSGRS